MSKSRNEYMRSYREKKKSETTEASKLLDELTRSYKANRKLITDAMAALNPGTKVYLDHVTALDKLDRNHRAELVERGLTPGHLGNATTPKWKFICVAGRAGAVTVIEVKEGQPDPRGLEFPQRNEQDLEIIEELEKEFPN